MSSASKVAAVISILLLLLAVTTQLPYGFYTFLRIVVCGSATWLTIEALQSKEVILAWLLGAVAVLFNPIFPIYMRRTQWRWFDFITLFVFAVSLGLPQRRPRAQGA